MPGRARVQLAVPKLSEGRADEPTAAVAPTIADWLAGRDMVFDAQSRW